MADNSSTGLKLVVAEKPSVARDIARVLGIRGGGKGYIGGGPVRITWCLGHLVELDEPGAYDPEWKSWRLESLPMLPDEFRLKPRADSVDQWRVVRDLLRDRSLVEVVNACDAGREGELIFAYAYQLAGCGAPVRRLWISSMTDTAIRQGFNHLRPGRDLLDLADAARCRSEADWLVGLNATRAMTTRSGQRGALLSVGRVQTPTLALLDARETAIEEFVPHDFWEVRARFRVLGALPDPLEPPEGLTPKAPDALAGEEWEAVWTGEDTPPKEAGIEPGKADKRIWDKQRAEEILARIQDPVAWVVDVRRKTINERPPLLYDLTTLQKEANRRWRFTAQKTLDLAQRLYEVHKVLTYPRTDSRHLGSDQEPGLPALVQSLAFGPYQPACGAIAARMPVKLGRRFVDDAEVSDHHAIIPTGVDPRPLNLSPDEKRIFDLVVRRFLAIFLPDAIFATVVVDTRVDSRVNGQPFEDHLIARGRSCLDPGWQTIDPPRSKRSDKLLPPLDAGLAAEVAEAHLHQGRTQPPRRHNEASLLTAMENASEEVDDAELKRAMKRNGLGTPATRANIIETLLRRRFIERQGADLHPTPQGRALLRALPIEDLRSPALTGAWEARLVAVAEGKEDRHAFMKDIRAFTRELVAAIQQMPVSQDLMKAGAAMADGDVLGPCPRCEGSVREGRRGWACPGCGLRIPDLIASRQVSARMARRLLAEGNTPAVKGFKSRAGKAFSAGLELDLEAGEVKFYFPEPDALGPCPACGRDVRRRGKVYTCETGRDCAFVVFAEMSGREIPEGSVRRLLAEGVSDFLTGFKTREGEAFDGVLRWGGDRVRVERADARDFEPPAGACPRCRGEVRFARRRWRCAGCDFKLPGEIAGRELRREEIAALLGAGRTPRLHGFRQKSGAVFKAALVLGPDGSTSFDYSKPPDEPPPRIPTGGPPPAFGERTDCPLCVVGASPDPGYVIRGRAAWGCSEWRRGCRLKIPFTISGRRMSDDEITRLFSKHHATRYLKGFLGPDGAALKTCRVALAPEGDPCWVLEQRGGKRAE
jgi:DNA topoisomerase-3